MAKKRTKKKLLKALLANLDSTYDLISVAYDDRLTDEQVEKLVTDDFEGLWESFEPWESDARYAGLDYVLDDLFLKVIGEWEREDGEDYTDLRGRFEDDTERMEELREAIFERDSGDWFKELVSQTPPVLLRVSVLDEDHAYSFKEVQPEQVLSDVGLPVTEGNIEVMESVLLECSPEFSVLMGYWIVGADVSDLNELDSEVKQVTITNPHLYLGNPFTGSGWVSEKPFEGVVVVDRDELHTDKEAFGYSIDSIYGGVSASSFAAEIKPKTEIVRYTAP